MYLALEKVVAMREDLSKAERKAQLEGAFKALMEYGEPPGDEDEMLLMQVCTCRPRQGCRAA